jgi:hypothetical protein
VCGTIFATQTLRRMRGGSQSQLMRCSDGETYVVKFQNNPQGIRILANELFGGLLAKQLGLPIPEVAVIEVSKTLIMNSDDLVIQRERGRSACQSGLCVGSRYPRSDSSFPGSVLATVYDVLPQKLFPNVDNLLDFLGMLVFDTWVGNMDSRQVVFVRDECNTSHWPHCSYHAMMIDEGFCFNACKWNFPVSPRHGLYDRAFVYDKVSGLDVFEKWLNRLECGIDRSTIQQAADEIPLEWNNGAAGSLKQLVERLDERRFQVRDLLLSARSAVPRSFPAWHFQPVTRTIARPTLSRQPRNFPTRQREAGRINPRARRATEG